jgi:hypothetical protein
MLQAGICDPAGFLRLRETIRRTAVSPQWTLRWPRRRGKLASAKVTQEFKDAMLLIPERMSIQVAAEPAEDRVYAILCAAFRGALTEFADSCEAGCGSQPGTTTSSRRCEAKEL